ncbi:MAG: radical SAM protein [Dactylosporangium sp.]|nr:radical SAM protein [Dactylosporangium sp.]NNJ63520.1 radical SAM protein [Dactylosporangium sp.]
MRGISPVPGYVVMQANTLCNLACTYCYLPDRAFHRPTPVAVARAVAESTDRWAADDPGFAIVWHGGEPLAAGRPALAALMEPFGDVEHQVQTNATLINDDWCRFFSARRMRVSVSVDGPEECNDHRVIRGFGRPAYPRIIKGIEALRRNGVPFAALCVVSNPRPGLASRLYDYFLELGCDALGVSIEEQEGVNERANDAGDDAVRTFWAELAAAWRRDPSLRIREIDHVLGYAGALLAGAEDRVLPRRIDPTPMISPDGRAFLLSPELAGFTDPGYGDFSAGNVLRRPLNDIVSEAIVSASWVTEFVSGVEACRRTCPYFGFCGGANAGNRYFEHGRFDQTHTNHCRNSRIRLLEGVLDEVAIRSAATDSAATRIHRAADEFALLIAKAPSAAVTEDRCESTGTYYNWNNRSR